MTIIPAETDELETTTYSTISRALASRSFVIGAAITALIAFTALLSFFWTPNDVTKLIIANRLQTPSLEFWFGTDHFGRDIFSMIMVGARNSIAVALVAVAIGMSIGIPLGAWAAAKRGWIDDVLMRANDLVLKLIRLVLYL